MDDTVYKIALAAFLHDIGKFAERAGMNVTQEYLDNNATLYQPEYKHHYSHKHAVYTAAFIEKYGNFLPPQLNGPGWGDGDPFLNLAAMHHKPETAMQWIITTADRISSGMDRAEFEEHAKEVQVRDYKKTRLVPILEGVRTKGELPEDNLESYRYRYALGEITPEGIFPKLASASGQSSDDAASREYRDLFARFTEGLGQLAHKGHIPLWFENLDSLLMRFASHIPAATVGKVIPDVSLYDHSRTTAALATAIYLYHFHNDTLNEEGIRSDEEKKLLVVTGDFYGIQSFIFSEGGSTNKASAKILRGRSFAVSLLSELAAHMVAEEAGLPHSSVVLNAAGKFTAILPNTKEAIARTDKVEETINAWLIENYFGEVSIGFSTVEASCADFLSSSFEGLWDRVMAASEKRKYHKIDLERYGGTAVDHLDKFNNDLNRKLCPFCGKRPSSREVEDDGILGDTRSSCTICRDHIYLGANLVRANRLAVTSGSEIQGDGLREPIFGRYQVSLHAEKKSDFAVNTGNLIKYWDISPATEQGALRDTASRFINGYVPVFSHADTSYDMLDRLLGGRKSTKKMDELFDLATREQGQPKPFDWLAKMAQTRDENGKLSGIEALGVLKADIDHLGLVLACGMKHPSLSRLSTLSRQINYYFAVHLPFSLKTRPEFRDIYTVFAGGDDLFLIGPWNRMIEFARFLKNSFADYVCHTEQLTISAGIFLCKTGEPVLSIQEKADNALKLAKGNDRDSIAIFGIPVKWETFGELESIRETIAAWVKDGTINNAMLYRFNELIDMAKKEKELLRKETVSLEDLECLKWKARLKYSLARNVGKNLKGDEKRKAIEDVERMAHWLDKHGHAMRIPLWQTLYSQR